MSASIPRSLSSEEDSRSQASTQTDSSESVSRDLHVLVIGAGLTGLLIGQAHRKVSPRISIK